MINNTLIELLKSFSKDELAQFEDFVNSPYFNKKTAVLALFNYLRNFHPRFDDAEKLDRKEIYKTLYPGKPYNYGIMKNIIYELNLIGEKFLELVGYCNHAPEQFRYLLQELTNRKLNKAFKKNLKKAESLLELNGRDDMYFRNKMDIELLKFNFHIVNSGRTEKPKFDFQAGNYLVSFFLAKFFKINYNNLITKENFGTNENITFLDEVLSYIQKTPGIDPIVLLYYNRFMLMYKEDETTYREFKRLVKQHYRNIRRQEQFNTYNNLLNYCYGKIVLGNWGYYKDLFSIYNEMINNKIISGTQNDYFDTVHFRLAAEAGLRLKKFDWTKRFIKQYSEKLDPKLRTNEINFAFANYYFMKKNYDAAQHHIAQIHPHTAYDKIYVYIIQSMVHYETGQFENLISEIDSIRHFVANNKTLADALRNSLLKYVRYLNDMVRLNMKDKLDKQVTVRKLKNNLVSEINILEKGWLMEKVNELSSETQQK